MLYIVGGVFLIILGPFLYISSKRKSENLRRNGIHTQAAVVDIKYEYVRGVDSKDSRFYYFPLLEYTAGGITQTKKYGMGTIQPQFSVGEILNIVYDPEAPDTMELEDALANGSNLPVIFIMIVMIIVGAILLATGAFTAVLSHFAW